MVEKPERIGPALAQVVHVDSERDVILGQAWLAAANRLVTCGHVVERFAKDPNGLFVFFPSSGKRYPVQQVQLHPSFVRQPDGLVKFDAAALHVTLTSPDSLALPLPFSYEQELQTNEALWTIRYPVHLGQLSAAMQPLPQDGHFLGLLRKHDNFHLLHDVPLAPGDSGAPICDGKNVIALHCGDTATLPGLNLPTTSIRLALWVDALRELGLQETRRAYLPRNRTNVNRLLAFLVAAVLGFAGTYFAMSLAKPKQQAAAPFGQAALPPMRVNFNKELDAYKPGDLVEVILAPKAPCFPYLFLVDAAGKGVVQLYPQTGENKVTKDAVVVNQAGGPNGREQLVAGTQPYKFYAVAADPLEPALFGEESVADKTTGLLAVDETKLLSRLNELQTAAPGKLFFHRFDLQPAGKSF